MQGGRAMNQSMYPIKFENIYFDKIWGGIDFKIFRDNVPQGNIGESWDVACHKNGTSKVVNGEFKGMHLDELIKSQGEKLIGTEISKEKFPLLVKLINAKESLSVQVHPNDIYAAREGGELGKTEVWYVVEALEGANIIVGTKGISSKEQFKEAIEKGNLEPYMNKINVKKGEVYFVKNGLIHAIGRGVVIAEIQQNSDTTYRVYDYNRGRELHIEKALDVTDLSLKGERSSGLTCKFQGYSKTYYCLCKDFTLEMYDVEEEVTEKSDEERFFILTCVEGNGYIHYGAGDTLGDTVENGSKSAANFEKIDKGDSILIPATLGHYTLKGNMKVLKSYVPKVEKVKEEILSCVIK